MLASAIRDAVPIQKQAPIPTIASAADRRQVIGVDAGRQPLRRPDQQALLDAGKHARVESRRDVSRGSGVHAHEGENRPAIGSRCSILR